MLGDILTSHPDLATAIIGLIVAITAWIKIMAQSKQQDIQERKLEKVEQQQTRTVAVVSKHEGMLNGASSTVPSVLPGSSGTVPGDLAEGTTRIGDIT